jgi:hypothetical protein
MQSRLLGPLQIAERNMGAALGGADDWLTGAGS